MPRAIGHDQSGDAPESARPSWRPLAVLLAIAIAAVVVGATFLIAREDGLELSDSSQPATPTAGDDLAESAAASPDTCAVDDSAVSWQTAAPRGVRSTLTDEPTLEWRQIESPFDRMPLVQTHPGKGNARLRFLSDFHTTEDGRVAVVAQGNETAWLEMTSNGIDWEAFSLPRAIEPSAVHLSDDHWIVVGPARPNSGTEADPWAFDRVLHSDDRGTTWTEVSLDPETPPFVSEQWLYTLDVVVSRDRIMLVGVVWPSLQIVDLIADRGLIQSTAGAEFSGFGDRSVHVLIPPDDPEGGYTRAKFSYEQLELSARQETVMDLWRSAALSGQLGHVRVFVGDASGLSASADFDADSLSSVATSDGFMVASPAADQDSHRLLASLHGRIWSEIPVVPPTRVEFAGARDDRTMWALLPWDGVSSTIAVLRCGSGPRVTALLEGLIVGRPGDPGLAVGAAGLVAVAAELPDFQSMFEIGSRSGFPLFPEGRITRQGYELRLGEPEQGLTLWSVAQDVAVLEWENALLLGPPPWVHESGVGDDYELTITDPVGGHELVTFPMADLAEFINPLRDIASRSVTDPVWIGWSTDGADWDWQAALDAFGFEPSRFDVEMAVGDGFVLASIQGRGDPVWYMAEVP